MPVLEEAPEASQLRETRRIIYPTQDAAAILNAATGGEEFIFAEGTHDISSQITLSNLSNVTIRGSKASILNITYSAAEPFNLQAPLTDVEFRGFTINFVPSGNGHACFRLNGTGGALFERLAWRGINYVNDAAASGNEFIRNQNSDADIAGLIVEGCDVSGSTCISMLRFDLAANRLVKDVRCVNNSFHRDVADGTNVVFGVYGSVAGAIADGLVFANNTIRNADEIFGNYVSGGTITRNIVFEGNTIIDCGSATAEGITCNGDASTFVGNTFHNYTGNFAFEIYGDGNIINDNLVSGCSGDGIRIFGNENKIEGNDVSGCTGEGIYVEGNHNTIGPNKSHDNVSYGFYEPSGDGNHYIGNKARNNVAGNKSLLGTNRTQSGNVWP
jgi:hypothetical protein